MAAPRRKVTDQPLKMASNKAFQVSRKPQYQRKKTRSPLASLNEGKAETKRPLSKQSPQTSLQQMVLNSQSQENIYEVHILDTELGGNGVSVSPDGTLRKHENQDLIKILNKTLSPIGTPTRLKKLMPHIYHESPLSAATKPAASLEDGVRVTGTPILSVKDALALIDSDLSHINSSLQETSSSCSFSQSLGSNSGSCGCKTANFFKALPDSPQQLDACEQRLTFFVTKKVSEDAGSECIKKAAFTSVTVTKGKAPVEANSVSGRKIRKSKRRLMEKTLELSDGSSESGPGTPSLPVIEVDIGTEAYANAQPVEASTSILCQQIQSLPTTISSPFAPALSAPPGLTSPLPVNTCISSSSPLTTSSPLNSKLCLKSNTNEVCLPVSVPPPAQEDLFPIHMALKNKKRKSEEFFRSGGKAEDAGKTEPAKRTRVVAWKSESSRSVRRTTSQRMPGRQVC